MTSGSLPLPPGFEVSSLALHYEGDDLGGAEAPFAGNLIAQLRTDGAPGVGLDELLRADLDVLRAAVAGLEVVERRALALGAAKGLEVEVVYESEGRAFVQTSTYLTRRGRPYTIVAVHLAERFEPLRRAALALATTLADG